MIQEFYTKEAPNSVRAEPVHKMLGHVGHRAVRPNARLYVRYHLNSLNFPA